MPTLSSNPCEAWNSKGQCRAMSRTSVKYIVNRGKILTPEFLLEDDVWYTIKSMFLIYSSR